MMFIVNYLFALLAFAIIYLAERLILFWFKKKAIWSLVDFNLLKDAVVYSVLSLLLLGILHIAFRNILNLRRKTGRCLVCLSGFRYVSV